MRENWDRLVRDQMVALLPRLFRFALVLTRSRSDADDLVQATCERAMTHLDQWAPGTSLDRWLLKIAHNLYRDQQRNGGNRQRLLEDYGMNMPPYADGAGHADAHVSLQDVRRLILQLPEDQRVTLVLVAIEGLSYGEAAELLKVPVGTVTSRLARARGALRQGLEDSSGSPAGFMERV